MLATRSRLLDDLRSALQTFSEHYGHKLDIAQEIGVLYERHSVLVGRCRLCRQIVLARPNLTPRPLLFGRRKWQPVELVGSTYYCKWAQMQNWGIDHAE